ncbi:MAG: cytochrome P450, partial [Acidimicrobiaceae bacterium]|nr:cytochrome P450 [Acidimicrobiaceae bacterium]
MGLGDSISLADLEREPAPILARLRTQEPVCWIPAMDMWLVTRWDDVAFMEEHPELFTAATEPSFLARTLGSNMLTCDPPVHTRLQEIMQPPFQPGGRSGEFVSNELTGIADRLLDAVDPAGFDVMADYAQPLSAGTLATVLGLDSYGFDRMWDWCEGLCTDLANFEDDPDLAAIGKRTKADLGAVLAKRIAEAGNNGSAISWFVQNGATPEEIVNNVRLMISGGINEPRDGIGLVAWLLLSEPSLASAVDAEPTKMRRLIEEMFRVHSPVGTVTRQATQDLELAGVAIAKGDLVSGVLRSINLDESHWTNPDVIDLGRRE